MRQFYVGKIPNEKDAEHNDGNRYSNRILFHAIADVILCELFISAIFFYLSLSIFLRLAFGISL